MTTADDCIFCAIAEGGGPAEIVHGTEHTVAFRDLNPQAPVHVLIVPRRHIENAATVSAADAEVVGEMLVAARHVAESEGVADSGYRLVFNVGSDAANTVPHLHLHVLGGPAHDLAAGVIQLGEMRLAHRRWAPGRCRRCW